MSEGKEEARKHLDTGLQTLTMLLRFHGIAVDPAQIAHQLGGAAVGVPEMLRTARHFRLRTRVVSKQWARLTRSALPAAAGPRDGTFRMLAKTGDAEPL